MSDQEEKVEQFKGVTGANDERARFFLDSSAWQVEVAIARYYENEGGDDADVSLVEDVPEPTIIAKKPAPRAKSSNFHTLNTLTTSSDEEEEGQAYYAGGSEHSGQQVLGPPKNRNIVSDMFRSVQEHGVEILDPAASSSGSRVFKGTGYKLGQDTNDTVVIPGAADPVPPRQVTLRLWQNGFSINDEDLRTYNDPDNRDFLESIRRGEIPHELRQGGSEIHLAMEDHRMEEFRKITSRKGGKVFQGQGYTLGSPTPKVIGAPNNEDKPANEAKAKETTNVNTSEPTTNLQIRLADGTRLVGQFNHEHTVGAVRNYITIARPQYQTQPFNLMSSYPSKVLEDSQTLKEAGLLNAAIMQKLI
ncbi:unnamed protein product [Brassicogethes aeneus]|uniref:Uncharacterized protein n=1 Tax=Brassicogethes aeneus TaxID=1431903 RepID=A0A9P0B111_BRAAE|nr:unnamed protein product [Brassicogethes aeneus]